MKALLAILAIGLAACTEPAAETPRDEVREPTVFDDVTFVPLERAAGVEDTLRDSAADRRRQIEEAEGR
jgi:hypothetical protein